MIQIPGQNKQFNQNNKSDILGNIWSSFNLDLRSNFGRLRLSPRLMVSSSTEFVATITSAPCAFKYFSIDGGTTYKYWTIAGTKVHSGSSSLQGSFTADLTSGSPTTCDTTLSDMELAYGNLYVTVNENKLYKLTSSGTWSNFALGSDISVPRMMTVYGGTLYVSADTNKIYNVTDADVVSTTGTTPKTLTIGTAGDESNLITWIKAASNRIWIGTINRKGGKGAIHEWDGASTQVSRTYRLESQGTLACVIKDDVPYVVDTNGKLLVPNGGTFQEIARLPTDNLFLTRATVNVNNRFIHPNGMSVIDGRVCMLVNNLNGNSTGTINENLPSGIWEYDPNIGLYHRYSPSYYDDDGDTTRDYGQNRVSVVGALSDFKNFDASASANGTFLAGITYYTDASSTRSAIFIDDSNDLVQKVGYFVTPWIDSSQIKDTWQKIWITYRRFLDSNDKIVVKYRQNESSPTELSITWSASDSFVSTTDLSSYVGYEVEVIQGEGSGICTHITSVTTVGSNYLVYVDETMPITNGSTAKIRLQNWKKIGVITGQIDESSELALANAKDSERIQVKVWMKFTGKDQLHTLNIINQPKQALI